MLSQGALKGEILHFSHLRWCAVMEIPLEVERHLARLDLEVFEGSSSLGSFSQMYAFIDSNSQVVELGNINGPSTTRALISADSRQITSRLQNS